MDRVLVERGLALYGPIAVAMVGWWVGQERSRFRAIPMLASRTWGTRRGGGSRRLFAAGLLGVLWCLPALVLLQRWNLLARWWVFRGVDGVRLLGMPLEMWLGWVVLWGVCPVLCLSRLRLGYAATVLVLLDAVMMPLFAGSLRLGRWWFVGELVAVVTVLLPSLCLQWWTLRGERVRGRAALQVLAAGLVFLYLPAELVWVMRGGGWPAWWNEVMLQAMVLLAVPGLSAVQEFAVRGEGTPIPYDPPVTLVRTGVYRYVANPMQLSCVVVMVWWALVLRSGWMLLVPVMALVYSAGLAEWDEGADLRARFGEAWVAYRVAVRNWRPRWRPFVAEEAVVYIARGCEPCSALRRWVERRAPVGLRIVDAEMLPAGSILRMRYCCGSESVDGVRALGRVFEHLHVGWAFVGAVMRLTGVWWGLQVLGDASGFGPRVVGCDLDGRTAVR